MKTRSVALFLGFGLLLLATIVLAEPPDGGEGHSDVSVETHGTSDTGPSEEDAKPAKKGDAAVVSISPLSGPPRSIHFTLLPLASLLANLSH
jgi:hypothetical protein